jgi:hypothetical protein
VRVGISPRLLHVRVGISLRRLHVRVGISLTCGNDMTTSFH